MVQKPKFEQPKLEPDRLENASWVYGPELFYHPAWLRVVSAYIRGNPSITLRQLTRIGKNLNKNIFKFEEEAHKEYEFITSERKSGRRWEP